MARKDALLRLHKSLLERRDHLRRKLAEELAELQGYNAGDPSGDAADVAFEAGADEMSSQLAELDARELRKIETALKRLERGTYGNCESCQKKIPISRLNALPYTSLCIDCQREMEKYPDFDYRSGSSWENVVDGDAYEEKSVNISDIEMDLSRNP